MITLTNRYTEAVEYARTAHGGQVRKGTAIPYFAHLIGVSSLVLDCGGDEDQAIAGLLHDVVEDCGDAYAAVVRSRFGDRVADIVQACTDGSQEQKRQADAEGSKRADWEQRKRRYLAHLETCDAEALLVSGCDKLHNLRAILSDLRNPAVGTAVFDRFIGGRDGTLWYYGELATVFARRGHPASRELTRAVDALRYALQPDTAPS